MAKIVSMQKKDSNFVSGLPLTAFLQMLEQEQQTCSLFVSAEDKSGILFIKEGELIDAVADDVIGIEAANIILSWKDATIEMTDAEERTRKINTPLTHIILQATVKQDEALSSTPQQAAESKPESPEIEDIPPYREVSINCRHTPILSVEPSGRDDHPVESELENGGFYCLLHRYRQSDSKKSQCQGAQPYSSLFENRPESADLLWCRYDYRSAAQSKCFCRQCS